MRASAGTFAIGLMLSAALPLGAALAADPGEQLMLERASFWRAQHRLDIAGQILNKILAVNPTQPDALYQQAALATEQGDKADAQQYLDRLRQLVPSDRRAAELVGVLTPPPAAPAVKPVTVAVAPPAVPATPTPVVSSPVAPVAQAALQAPATPPAPRPAAGSDLLMASADSDDLTPAGASTPARSVAPPRALAAANRAPAMQVAASPTTATAVPQSDMSLPATLATAPLAGASDLGITARAVQVAQVELEPPAPIGGYQPLGTLRPYSPTDTLEIDIDRDLTRLEQQSEPELIAGLSFRGHTGQQGTGELTEVGTPVQASFSPWYTGTATIAVLPVDINAGSVGPITGFGANPMIIANGGIVPSGGSQNAAGVGLLGNYTLGDFSGQFGTTPLGFPITNLIGDLAYSPKFFNDTMTVRIEGLRQAVTDTVLSYAGTRANLTEANLNVVRPGAFGPNDLWGGVVKTGGQVTVFYDDQMYGAYAGGGAAWLTGTNVADNGVVNAQLGAYFRPWKTDNWAIRTGISFFYTGYDKNLGGFTFGQGGYFSPQNFEGLGFPIEWTGHAGPWSWLASTTLGVQHFQADSSPVFPNNPNAQLAIETLRPSLAFNNGISGGIGFGFNLKGQVEYALDKTTSLGLAGSLNNGNDYDEGIVQLYLRKTFDWFSPVAIKNDPEAIAARDMPMSHL